MLSSFKLIMIALNLCFGIIACPVRDTTLPISDSSLNVE